MNKKKILKLARIAHINNSVWSKMKEGTIVDFTCDWDDLTEFQRELYVAGIEFLLDYYRMNLSPIRWFWNLYYKYLS